jgi:predicted nuclease of predicted toxin-antitoxin system
MMRFLANENIPLAGIIMLRQRGYDVAAIIEESPGASDVEVLSRANRENRIILTFDRDYGELIFRLKYPQPGGVVYFRFSPRTPLEPAELMLRLLASSEISVEGRFTILERDKVRQRLLE